jgi:hypothetical protein
MRRILFWCLLLQFTFLKKGFTQNDTITVMTYNVLNYGDECQGKNSQMKNYLREIIGYAQPDILGLVKMLPIQRYPGDFSGYLPIDFLDTLTQTVLNSSGKIKYQYCPFTNEARGSDVQVLFYNQEKFGYLYSKILTVKNTDFDLFKFFYKDTNLVQTGDTTYFYVALFHTESGDDASTRNVQLMDAFNSLKSRFSYLPNLIFMGDYNLRNSEEIGYKQLVTESDSGYRLFDPPFSVDAKLSYPAMWDKSSFYSSYFTTSTRQYSNLPNSCGTSGGAKGWYDHILISNWVVNGLNYMKYLPNSYTTIGNDGKRQGISINDSTKIKNSSAPPSVINALYQLSNKYPISAKFVFYPNTNGTSLSDPERVVSGIKESIKPSYKLCLVQTEGNILLCKSEAELLQKGTQISIYDLAGNKVFNYVIESNELSCMLDLSSLTNGMYLVLIQTPKSLILFSQKIIL